MDGQTPATAPILQLDGIETPETVAARIRRALPYVAAEDIIVAPTAA